jgi:UDPglucose--hexose-1-phosphate uridylyltransferase
MRPHDTSGPPRDTACPFCVGNEALTPAETFANRARGAANSRGWSVRAFANKFPFLSGDQGIHEVVVNTPRHVTRFGDLTDAEARTAVAAWAERIGAVDGDPRDLWPFVFLNQGATAGASLSHSHAQVVGLPFAPPHMVAREHAFTDRSCPICAEMRDVGDRLVATADGLVAWCSTTPPLSGAVRIAPTEHVARWSPEPRAAVLGPLLRRVAAALELHVSPAVNIWFHEGHRQPGDFHWHVEVVPRIGTLAGLELGTGVLALTHDPASIAAALRGRL